MNRPSVAVIGLGYVGLPLALRFAENGVHVIGIDIDKTKVDQLFHGVSYLRDISSSRIERLVDNGFLSATTDFSRISEVDAVIICVPTPLTAYREPELSYIEATARSIAPFLVEGCVISLESTTYPGTSEEILIPILEEGSNLKAGEDFAVVYSPEREDPGNKTHQLGEIPKLIGGYTPECLARGIEIYRLAIPNMVEMNSLKETEAAKLLENIFRSVNIALVNELKTVFERMDVDVWEVIRGARTKPFGFMPFYPGPGLGGHCIPIDPFYLTWKAREYGIHTRFIELAGEINTQMPLYVVEKVVRCLNDNGVATKGASILVLGLAYKPDVSDDRESPSYRIIDLLVERGADVQYHDPFIPVIGDSREFGHLEGTASVVDLTEALENGGFDAIVVATAHSDYFGIDFSRISVPIIDTRNLVPSTYEQLVKA